MKIYLIGSLRNPEVPVIAAQLRTDTNHEIFDDWFAAGPEADDKWRDYEKFRGHNMTEAMNGYAAEHVFEYDKHHLETSDAAVVVLPAGKSGHLEAGYMLGRGKPVFLLYTDEPERFDVMYKFFTGIFTSLGSLIERLNGLEQRATITTYACPSEITAVEEFLDALPTRMKKVLNLDGQVPNQG